MYPNCRGPSVKFTDTVSSAAVFAMGLRGALSARRSAKQTSAKGGKLSFALFSARTWTILRRFADTTVGKPEIETEKEPLSATIRKARTATQRCGRAGTRPGEELSPQGGNSPKRKVAAIQTSGEPRSNRRRF